MQVSTDKTTLLGYGPKEGRIGQRMLSPPYANFGTFLENGAPFTAHSLSLETKHDTPSTKVNPSDHQPDRGNMAPPIHDDHIAMPDAEAPEEDESIPTDGARHLQGTASDSAPEPQVEVDTPDDSTPSETDPDVPTESDRSGVDIITPDEALKIAHDIRDQIETPIEYIALRTT